MASLLASLGSLQKGVTLYLAPQLCYGNVRTFHTLASAITQYDFRYNNNYFEDCKLKKKTLDLTKQIEGQRIKGPKGQEVLST